MDGTGTGAAYSLGHSRREIERLTTQAKLFEPATRRMLEEAGIASGMRVLDVGSGNGDVAMLVAPMVGPSGAVTGVERSPAAVESARERVRAAGFHNVTFIAGDAAALSPVDSFDAVVGRLVLGHQPEPIALLRHLSHFLVRGGVVAFQEFDMDGARSHPRCELLESCLRWIKAAFQHTGADIHMGLKLYSAFVSAGLPAPTMNLEALVGGGDSNPATVLVPEVIRSLLPVIERFGIATASEIEIETLRERLHDEIVSSGAIVISPSLIGAWTRLPEA